jgi:hypothetical protein
VWAKERAARNEAEAKQAELAARLTPNMQIYVDGSGIRERPTESASGKWVQFTVQGTIDTPLNQCEAWITQIDRLNANDEVVLSLVEEPIRCEWSQMKDDERLQLTIPPRVPQKANLFFVGQQNPTHLIPLVEPRQITLLNEIQTPGIYRISVLVHANRVSLAAAFKLEWRDYGHIILTEAKIT